MGIAAVIAALIEVLGPLMVEWLKKWLEGKLRAAAGAVDFEGKPAAETVGALFDEAIRQTPRFALPRRVLLRRLKAAAVRGAPQVMAGAFALTATEADEIKDVAALVQEIE